MVDNKKQRQTKTKKNITPSKSERNEHHVNESPKFYENTHAQNAADNENLYSP